ncbi:unnamed protein product [Onchocerca ochengi]|uniref:KNOX2 domain-containing protein n=1 Tax=Onchocerca ochengi TaxID=42157 RepID=A0A182E4T2_ONCOC|nr:unnamed protein product [Onchocerca ochengi]
MMTSDCENNFDENFDAENLSGSLEDLVGTFDQKISHCFKNLNETTEEIAPIQVRSQDEIMSESHLEAYIICFGTSYSLLSIRDPEIGELRKLTLEIIR